MFCNKRKLFTIAGSANPKECNFLAHPTTMRATRLSERRADSRSGSATSARARHRVGGSDELAFELGTIDLPEPNRDNICDVGKTSGVYRGTALRAFSEFP